MPRAKAGRSGKESRKPAALDENGRRRLRELRQELMAYYPGPMPRSRLVLMDVDPSTLHAYWSIDADYLAGLRRRHRTPKAPLVLRLHEIKGQAEASRPVDFDLDGLTNNRYVHLWAEGRTYLGQMGLKTRRRFISVATSEPVRMPETGPAPPPAAAEEALGDEVRVVELEAEREALIRSRYRELAERAAAGGPEGFTVRPQAAPPMPPLPERPAAPEGEQEESPAAPSPVPEPAAAAPRRHPVGTLRIPAHGLRRHPPWSLDLALRPKVPK